MTEGALTIKLLSLAALLIKQCAAPAVFSQRWNCNDTSRPYKNFSLTLQEWMAVEVSNRPCFIAFFDIPT